jgi:hypothetical protein
MQAILELQRQLKEIQAVSINAAHKINERNVVDIIRKLIDANKVRLIYTSDGKEYLTHEQLDKEIKDLLAEQGGRINIIEIPKYLGINYEVIEKSMDNFVKNNKVSLINGQLISKYYIDSIMEELYELVTDSGIVFLTDLTTRYNLPVDFIKDIISQ